MDSTAQLEGAVSLLAMRDQDPYGLYARLRAAGSVTWDEGLRAWLVTGHDACAVVERREDLFGPGMGTLRGAVEITGRRSVLTMEGAAHAELHKFLARAMAPRVIEPLRPSIRALAEDLLDELEPEGVIELWERFASPLPVAVVARVLGLEHDRAMLARSKAWMEAVLAWRHTYGEDPQIVEAATVAARASVQDLLPTVAARRRDEPADDLISELWRVGPTILPDWSEEDVLDQCRVLFEAGSETTSHLIGTCVALLAADEALERRVRTEDRALIRLVEEALRLWTVVHMRVRVAAAGRGAGRRDHPRRRPRAPRQRVREPRSGALPAT